MPRRLHLALLSLVLVGSSPLLAACDDRPRSGVDGSAGPDGGLPRGADGSVWPDGGFPGSDGSVPTDGGAPSCGEWVPAQRPTFWSLPSGFQHFNGWASSSAYCGTDRDVPEHIPADLDGDGRLDLVIVADCDDDTVGVSRWRVHRGTAGGFEETPTFWALPSGFQHFNGWASSSAYCGTDRDVPEHIPADLDGDGRLDLVIVADCDDETVGVSRWRVHRGTAGGFEETPTFWALPSGFQHFNGWASSSAYCGTDRDVPEHIPADLDGDGRLDLVIVADCDDDTVGVSRWRVHRGTAGGFEETPTFWALPSGFQHFNGWASSSAYCGTDRDVPEHIPADLDGDGRLDLVIVADCDDDTVGVSRWRVHRGTAGGFEETPTFWALPSGFQHFNGWASSSAYCGTDRDVPEHIPADLDGDGRLDLVIVADCDDDTVGVSRWRVHRGTAGGFEETPTFWALPSGYQHFNGWASSSAYCGTDRDVPEHIPADLDGDGRLDLIVVGDCDDTAVGVSRWRVYLQRCADDTPPICTDGPEDDAASCSDTCSNDGDDAIDCDDPDCNGVGTCQFRCPMGPEDTVAACSDGCSNDGDDYIDCADFDCDGVGACAACAPGPENTPARCSDGCSNDGDPYVDCDDFDCAGVGTCS